MNHLAAITTKPSLLATSRRTALVTGGTGAVGPVLVQHLLEQGYKVRIVARQAPAPSNVLPSIEFVCSDIASGNELRAAAEGVDIIFHLAAKLHVNNPHSSLNDEFYRVNVEGTRQIMKAAQAAGVRRVIFFSTISVYGPSVPGHIWNERSPLNPQTVYGATKADAEQIVLQATQPDSHEPLGVVLRLAAVYGPRVKGNYARLISALEKGRFVPVGGGGNRRTLVYDQDVARAAVHVAVHPAAAGQIYNLTDGHVHTFNEIVVAICQALRRHKPRYHLPAPPVRAAASIIGTSFRLIGRTAPIDAATVDKLLEDVAVSGEKLQRDLGFLPQFDLQSGWHNYVAHRPVSSPEEQS